MSKETLTLGDMEVNSFIGRNGDTTYELVIDNGIDNYEVALDKDQLDNLRALLDEVDTDEDYYRLT